MKTSTLEIAATCLFAAAVLHTFLTSWFQHLSRDYANDAVAKKIFHLLGEVELVFGMWAALLLIIMSVSHGLERMWSYVSGLSFSEPIFVIAIMVMASTRPIVSLASKIIVSIACIVPLNTEAAFFLSCLIFGPLLGSFITEPAAMTITALLLKERYFDCTGISSRFKYLTLAVLFVNVSIGGVLTHFAAPPVLMVAAKWNWNSAYMMEHFGWRAIVATVVNASMAGLVLQSELNTLSSTKKMPAIPIGQSAPAWLISVQIALLAAIVIYSHHVFYVGVIFFLFLAIVALSQEHHEKLRIRESFLVGFFLAGLVILGGLQTWWISPLIQRLNAVPLFLGTTALTAVTDNAVLTYLGSQVDKLSEGFKYALVAGAVCGGGLTVIANAPNPAGLMILQKSFGEDGVKPLNLLLAALAPTIVCVICFWLLAI